MAGPGRPKKQDTELQKCQQKIQGLLKDMEGMSKELQAERLRSDSLVNMMAEERRSILQYADSLFDDMQNALDSIERTTGTVMRSDVEYHAALVRRMLHFGLAGE
jgi:peptidoglycan hydrolase CwlO-like protein